MKSLLAARRPLSDPATQRQTLQSLELPLFPAKLSQTGLWPLRPTALETLQLNLGKVCNQTCAHCHVDAGPDRREVMTRPTMQLALEVLAATSITVVDITGGAPEMNPDFRWLVQQISRLGRKTLVRCNLTIIEANPRYHDLPEFYAAHGVEVVSSLPFYEASRTDRQRGNGVFEASVRALQRLNAAGYGQLASGLLLDLVYNPAGAFLPPDQAALEADFKRILQEKYGIVFNRLLAITNLPITRYLEYLLRSENLESYMETLVQAYNPAAAERLMCRTTLSVGYDGRLYDCDFNQMLELPVSPPTSRHIADFKEEILSHRRIVVGPHCYGCTAGAGSSCGGTLTASGQAAQTSPA